jgi:hypothetical protein
MLNRKWRDELLSRVVPYYLLLSQEAKKVFIASTLRLQLERLNPRRSRSPA